MVKHLEKTENMKLQRRQRLIWVSKPVDGTLELLFLTYKFSELGKRDLIGRKLKEAETEIGETPVATKDPVNRETFVLLDKSCRFSAWFEATASLCDCKINLVVNGLP